MIQEKQHGVEVETEGYCWVCGERTKVKKVPLSRWKQDPARKDPWAWVCNLCINDCSQAKRGFK